MTVKVVCIGLSCFICSISEMLPDGFFIDIFLEKHKCDNVIPETQSQNTVYKTTVPIFCTLVSLIKYPQTQSLLGSDLSH